MSMCLLGQGMGKWLKLRGPEREWSRTRLVWAAGAGPLRALGYLKYLALYSQGK